MHRTGHRRYAAGEKKFSVGEDTCIPLVGVQVVPDLMDVTGVRNLVKEIKEWLGHLYRCLWCPTNHGTNGLSLKKDGGTIHLIHYEKRRMFHASGMDSSISGSRNFRYWKNQTLRADGCRRDLVQIPKGTWTESSYASCQLQQCGSVCREFT